MENKITIIEVLRKDIFKGINLFEAILFLFTSIIGFILFILTITIWSNETDSSINLTNIISNFLVLFDIPLGILAATFLSKKSRLAPLLLCLDAIFYGSANFIAGQLALGFVNAILTPLIYIYAYLFVWPKRLSEEKNTEVNTKKLNWTSGMLLVLGILLVSISFAFLIPIINTSESDSGSFLVWFDSFAASLMLFAVIMGTMRYREMWYLYFISNTLKIILFSVLVSQGELDSILLLTLATSYWINTIFGMAIWKDSEIQTFNKNKK
ncbi:MAG: hypothetical protein TYPL_0020 [Candidatus Tyloplasma litorale]|nr:MAG: hypothetical protein TYPL_0020 [Mycoplasmatales bacterium]